MKTEPQKDATLTDGMPWDSLESDTESLVQEKAYQRELQMRIARDSGLLSTRNSKQKSDKEGSEYSEEHHDALQDFTKPTQAKRQQTTDRHGPLRQTGPEDEYDDLRYDPNWRKNLKGAQFLTQLNARLSLDSFGESEDSLEPLEDVAVGQRQEYIVVSNQPALEVDAGMSPLPSSPFRLHPPQETSARDDVLDTSNLKPSGVSPERASQTHDREHQNVKQRSVVSQKTSYQHTSNVKQVKAREDIVERNKNTFGINAHKQGSYLKAHRHRDKVGEKQQPRRTSCETISTRSPESQDNVHDPELMWLQKTQKLKQSHKERKDPKKRERTNNQAPEAKPRPGVYLKPITERRIISADHLPQANTDAPEAYSYSHNPLQHHPPHSNTAPTVNLNINLTSSANHAQSLNLTQQETIFTLVSQALQWERPDLFNPSLLQPGFLFPPNAIGQMGFAPPAAVSSPASHSEVVQRKHAVDRDAAQGLVQRHARKPLLNAFENASFKNHNRIRIPVLKLPTSPQAEASHYPPEFMPIDDGSSVLQIQTSGAYTVLPPIGRSNASDTELCSDTSEQQLNPIYRSSSEGYLSQMERHRQLKAQTNYKPYTLKDYKNLKQEVKLGGLGPTNTIPGAVAEKIRQQKLYSNVIREQNKKISRIPSLPAKDPVGSDNKDTVPRRKALEYAKTITKPKASPKTNDRPKEKNLTVQAPYPQQMDPVHLATLEMLKRHEEEKRTVARFRTVHAI